MGVDMSTYEVGSHVLCVVCCVVVVMCLSGVLTCAVAGAVQELIGHNHTVEQIRDHIGADSLGYLSIEGMMQVVREGVVDQDKGARLQILLFSSSLNGR